MYYGFASYWVCSYIFKKTTGFLKLGKWSQSNGFFEIFVAKVFLMKLICENIKSNTLWIVWCRRYILPTEIFY